MKTEIVKIDLIKQNPNNPRTIKDDKFNKLVKSIKDFPDMLNLRPIVVNKDMIVLGGNMRLKACVAAGLKTVPIIRATNLTEEQQREFIIKDNLGFGDIVADGFLGSGTTMVAAHQLNRRCFGVELDPKYCQVIVDRMLKLDPTLIVKRNGGKYERPK